jgi:hypothetical protein
LMGSAWILQSFGQQKWWNHQFLGDFPMNSKRLSVQDSKLLFFSLKGFVLGRGNTLDFGWFPVQFPWFLPLCCSTSLPERQRSSIARKLWLISHVASHWGSIGVPMDPPNGPGARFEIIHF